MAQLIQLKRSAVAGRVPTTANLALGELAINVRDGKLYFQRDDSTIQTILTTNASITGDLTLIGTVTATSFVGDGSQLTGLATNLQEVTDNGASTANTIEVGGLDSSGNITLANSQELRWQDNGGTASRILELASNNLLELAQLKDEEIENLLNIINELYPKNIDSITFSMNINSIKKENTLYNNTE